MGITSSRTPLTAQTPEIKNKFSKETNETPIAPLKFDELDPRSPSNNRTPLSQITGEIRNQTLNEIGSTPIGVSYDERDPRSPNFMRTPLGQLLKERKQFYWMKRKMYQIL